MKMIRSRRRSIALEIRPDGSLIVRVPHFLKDSAIHTFLEQKRAWIEKTSQTIKERLRFFSPQRFTEEEIKLHKEKAFSLFTERCRFYASSMGVRYRSLSLSNAKSRWGSCSPHGRLRLHWKLILAPLEILDYVVVHELAHLKELNHSRRFWAIVQESCPDYVSAKKWLKEKGWQLQ